MATHITMAASNSQRGFDTMESSESMRSSASKRTRRSTADHIAESYKLAKKKMHSNLKNSNFKPWLVPVKYRVVNTVDNFDVRLYLYMRNNSMISSHACSLAAHLYVVDRVSYLCYV